MAKDRPSLVATFVDMCSALNRDGFSSIQELCGPIPRRFHVTNPSPGVHVILEEHASRVFTKSAPGEVSKTIGLFVKQNMHRLPDFVWNAKQIDDFVKFWIYHTPNIPMPVSWCWKSEDVNTFNRLPWDMGDPSPTPTWDSIIGRMDNAKAFKQWIGSIFVPESYRQQYVWMHGEGGDGKGCIDRFLGRVLGNAYASEVAPAPGDKFWSYGLIGKRVVSFPDTHAAGFPSSAMFKSISGGDAVRMEIKGGAAFSMKIDSKFLFSSQKRPDISGDAADLRRIILVEIRPRDDKTFAATFEDDLYTEGGAFLSQCIFEYLDHCPDHGPLEANTDSVESIVADAEAHHEALFDEAFMLAPELQVTAATFAAVVLRLTKNSHRETIAFRRWLESTHKIRCKVVRDGTKTKKIYPGIALNSHFHHLARSDDDQKQPTF